MLIYCQINPHVRCVRCNYSMCIFLLITGLELTLPYLSPLLVREKLVIGANFASTGLYSRFVSVIKLLIQFNSNCFKHQFCQTIFVMGNYE
ncbi:hypothetical protein MtrunA17_Chr7g0274981 [Medicago truncatula]|uniref:Transmembrane protein n=1 Tax=Medicago truncatula TaxID=3880 RepID=A0A396H892_MEDTR|nr:hypothetical protein MtrunA17_Chr7g0274981 [Medicago truncatula]